MLKENVCIFKNRDLCLVMGVYLLKYHKWTDFQKKNNRIPKTINQAVSFANRYYYQIPSDKSSNIDSYQQSFCNTFKKNNNLKYKSKRKIVSEEFYNNILLKAKQFKINNFSLQNN